MLLRNKCSWQFSHTAKRRSGEAKEASLKLAYSVCLKAIEKSPYLGIFGCSRDFAIYYVVAEALGLHATGYPCYGPRYLSDDEHSLNKGRKSALKATDHS